LELARGLGLQDLARLGGGVVVEQELGLGQVVLYAQSPIRQQRHLLLLPQVYRELLSLEQGGFCPSVLDELRPLLVEDLGGSQVEGEGLLEGGGLR